VKAICRSNNRTFAVKSIHALLVGPFRQLDKVFIFASHLFYALSIQMYTQRAQADGGFTIDEKVCSLL